MPRNCYYAINVHEDDSLSLFMMTGNDVSPGIIQDKKIIVLKNIQPCNFDSPKSRCHT